jgi:hypothetical protein
MIRVPVYGSPVGTNTSTASWSASQSPSSQDRDVGAVPDTLTLIISTTI